MCCFFDFPILSLTLNALSNTTSIILPVDRQSCVVFPLSCLFLVRLHHLISDNPFTSRHYAMAHASGANSMNGIKVIKPYPLIKLPSARTAARRATISDTSGVAQTPPRRTALSADDKLYPVEFSQGGFPPNLEEFIPEPLLPENLLVIAELECLEGDTGRFLDGKNFKPKQQSASATAVKHKYRRVLPAIPLGRSPAHRKGTANLWLSEAGLCGVGHHSSVHKAHFRLPEPLATNSRSKWNGRTSVIAKLAFSNEENPCQASNQASDREHLLNEAKVFDQLTKNHPRLQHAHYKVDRDRSRNRYLTRMAAVVPKFYGYYLPVGSDVEKLSPILLIEDCGVPIKLPLSYENTYVSSSLTF